MTQDGQDPQPGLLGDLLAARRVGSIDMGRVYKDMCMSAILRCVHDRSPRPVGCPGRERTFVASTVQGMTAVFHLGLTADMLQATLALVPGDPGRVERLAATMDRPEFLASHREFTSWLGWLGDTPVVVCSSGIGGPVDGDRRRGTRPARGRTFLRVGTTGIRPDLQPGDVIVTTGAVSASTERACTSLPWSSPPSLTSCAPPHSSRRPRRDHDVRIHGVVRHLLPARSATTRTPGASRDGFRGNS